MGYPDGIYRVGPLARLNVADRCGTPRADEELEKFRWRVGRVAGSSFHYHYARLIDTLHAIEKIEELLNGPEILSKHTRSVAGINRNEGIGVSEAPRGTLMHHYKVDDNGLVEWANLVIATGHNNAAMNRAVLQVARKHVKGDRLEESMLNRVEAVIRCYDPCLSCSTHALGQMALQDPAPGPGREGPGRAGPVTGAGASPGIPLVAAPAGSPGRPGHGRGLRQLAPVRRRRRTGGGRAARRGSAAGRRDHPERAPADPGARGRRQPGLAARPRGRGDRRGAGRGVGAAPRAVARRGRDRLDASPRPVGSRGARAGALGQPRRPWSWSASARPRSRWGRACRRSWRRPSTRAADLVATVVEAHRRA